MTSASVRDLRYRFSELEAHLRQGEEIEIRRRQRAIAKLVPLRPPSARKRDFQLAARKIFGRRALSVPIAEVVAYGRGQR